MLTAASAARSFTFHARSGPCSNTRSTLAALGEKTDLASRFTTAGFPAARVSMKIRSNDSRAFPAKSA